MSRVLLVLCLLFTAAISGHVAEKQQKHVKKRNAGRMDDLEMNVYQDQIIPGMVDDQVAEAFLKDAAAEEEREARRAEETVGKSGESSEEEEEEGSEEMPVALPMSRIPDQEMAYAEEKSSPHRSKALPDDVYPIQEGEAYLPYYPAPEIYFRRRRRSGPPRHSYRKRSAYTPVRDLLRSGRLRSARRKRQIRLSDNDLGALIAFLTDLKVSIERSARECNNPAHHSFFRENEINEELGAGSGIDDDYGDDQPAPSPEQEYPVWLVPRNYPSEPTLPVPQRRSFYYPSMVPGQKRAGPAGNAGMRPSLETLETKLLGWGSGRGGDSGPPRRFFQ